MDIAVPPPSTPPMEATAEPISHPSSNAKPLSQMQRTAAHRAANATRMRESRARESQEGTSARQATDRERAATARRALSQVLHASLLSRRILIFY